MNANNEICADPKNSKEDGQENVENKDKNSAAEVVTKTNVKDCDSKPLQGSDQSSQLFSSASIIKRRK
jgi:hypothetical protein